MRLLVLCAIAILACAGVLRADDLATTRTADGFQCPVGPDGTGEGYYVARGYRPNGHLGEDWNGVRGGDTDLGDPVYSVAHGLVVFARNYHAGWGNVVIIRHAYYEGFSLKYVDSLYGHLLDFKVEEGDQVKRGQLIGRLGSNNGMYDAHLHFEMRKNLQIGMYRSSFARDFTNYYSPSEFIASHRICDRGNRTARLPINTFPTNAPPSYVASKVYTPVYAPGNAPVNPAITSDPVLPPARIFAEAPPPKSTPAPEPVVVTKLPTTKDAAEETSAKPTNATAQSKATPTRSRSTTAAKEKVTAAAGPKGEQTPRTKPLPPIAEADTYNYEPPQPAESMTPTQGGESPIRRGSRNFQVDRFPEMRGKGY